MKPFARFVALTVVLTIGVCSVASAQDNLDGPWAMKNANLMGQARSDEIPVIFGTGTGAQEAFRLDTLALGLERTPGWGGIAFDSSGNIYWKTNAGNNKLAKVDPDGNLLWVAKGSGGGDYVFGNQWNSTSPVVGQDRIYALGAGVGYTDGNSATPDASNRPVIAAFNKTTGALIWETFLPETGIHPFGWEANAQRTPLLYNGKIYVVGQLDTANASFNFNVYQLDAATGAIDWDTTGAPFFWFVSGPKFGTTAFAPNLFGAGIHGIFVNSSSGSGMDGVGEVFAIRVDTIAMTATEEWQADGGHVSRGHTIFNPANNRVYTHTFADYGNTCYSFDALTGVSYAARGPSGLDNHGFYDFGALSWDDNGIVAGGARGGMVTYTEDLMNPGNLLVDGYQYTDDECAPNWFGEFRVLGQLLMDKAGNSIAVGGTNSRVNEDAFDPFCPDAGPAPYPDKTARVVVMNLDASASVLGAEDGPAYIDDIEVLEGPDLDNLVSVFSEDFEAYTNGVIPGQGGWLNDSAPPSGDTPPVVADDPTGGGNGKILLIDANGNNSGWQGATIPLPTPATGDYRVIRWRQYREDLKDNLWIDSSPGASFSDSWLIEWDSSGTLSHKGFNDSDAVALIADQWQTVSIIYGGGTVVIDVDGVQSGAPDIDLDGNSLPYTITNVTFELEGTGVTDPENSVLNLPMVVYDTGINSQNGFTIRGGPVAGPDGKIYFFDTNSKELIALEPQFVKGDSNCDGVLTAADIVPFAAGLVSGEAGWTAANGGAPVCNFLSGNDMNNDNVVDGDDIQIMVQCLLP
ncbi:MAG: PQQ-binding-like beta-propeller repeat protein [Phycisphaerales bacterium]|nr:PQQ-binding-like beta-propeller repeat protein [Phycisphaerales bacterium]MCB9863179.1 PQQ-binding-like beta-propeller repeat protein [Phycisphaerales bacterium]